MKNLKELFKNARAKVAESKISTSIKGAFSKIKNSKIMTSVRSKMEGLKGLVSNFTKGHQNVTDVMAGNVSNRFSDKFKKFFKNSTKKLQKKANDGSKFAKFMTIAIKVLSIIATIAFAILVIYCIKDVFLYCVMLVATAAATVLCIEFILTILSIATGCRI